MDKILAILNEIRPEYDFSKSSDFIEEGLLDSFDVITLVTELDSSFGISIDGVDIRPENFKSIESIKGLLVKKGIQL